MNMSRSFCSKDCTAKIREGRLQCHCGEDIGEFRWCWSKCDRSSCLKISKNNKDILFHPLYSSGTAVVRGEVPFEVNMHYYWEIKIISNLYGTDVMIGVGTQTIDLSDGHFRFCSLLGIDSQSWGYSYHGKIQHNKLVRKYGTKFGQGSIVGVHLNMYDGTLEYHVNRKPLGIAFTDLKSQKLYPMVSSTAAQSSVRIICSVSEESTLQMKCLQIISKHPALYKKYTEIPGLTRLYDKKYFWIVPTNEFCNECCRKETIIINNETNMNSLFKEDEEKRLTDLEDQLMCPLSYGNFVKRKKTNSTYIRWIPPNTTNYEEDGIIIAVADLDSSDEESNIFSTRYPSRIKIKELLRPSTSNQIHDASRSKIRRIGSLGEISIFDESSDSS